MKNNITFQILAKYLKSENIILDFEELQLQLLSHPSYPSLHSITGVLDHFNIENLALEVPVNLHTLNQLPKTFISIILEKEKEEFVLIHQFSKQIEIVYGDHKKKGVLKDEFINIWSGFIVIIENDGFENTNSLHKIDSLSNVVYILTTLIILSVFFLFNPSIFHTSHFILSLLGIGVSLLLVKHELGYQSKTVDKFCNGESELTNCDAVLNSKGASISKDFKLSDISLIYFIGLAILWILLTLFSSNYSIIVFLSLIALPITFYSIYYQYRIVKKWCPLCLITVAILWLQVMTIFATKNPLQSIHIDITSSFIFVFSFLLVSSLWLFIKPLLKKQIELGKLKVTFYKFKRNYTLFEAVYDKVLHINTNINSGREIILGNKNATLNLMLVTNPSCYYCKEAHHDLENILKNNSDNVNITIRFNIPQDKENISNKVANRLLEIFNKEEDILLALHEAYKSEADLDQWLLKWGNAEDNIYANLLEMQQEWCHAHHINFTPALFINGKQFPKEYERTDLQYFIEDIIENIETNKNNEKELEIMT